MGEIGAYRVLVGVLKDPTERPMPIWENNTKVDLKDD